MEPANVALAPHLRSCPAVITLGVRPCLDDYSEDEKRLLRKAPTVFFPSPRYVDILEAAGKRIFPSGASYRYQRSRILQRALFQYLELPHPRSHICFGRRQKQEILKGLKPPFYVMGPRASRESILLARTAAEGEEYCRRFNPVIIREFVGWERRISLIWVGRECIAALQQTSNGPHGTPCEPLPLQHPSLNGPIETTARCLAMTGVDDILVEWACTKDQWQILGMARPPRTCTTPNGTLDRHQHISRLIESGLI